MDNRARLSPSNLLRRERCPGSLNAESGIPEEPKSEAAGRGTLLHQYITTGIKTPDRKIDGLSEAGQDAYILESCWAEAQKCWDSLSADQRRRAIVGIEKTIDLSNIGMDQGTPDFYIVVPPTEIESGLILVRDWKTGTGWVPPARFNLQIMAYAAAIAEINEVKDCRYDLGIVQPAVRPGPDVWVSTAADMDQVKDTIRRISERCKDPNAVVLAGPHCHYCRAANTCSARLAVAAEVVQIKDPVSVMTALEGQARRETYEKLSGAIKMLETALETIDTAVIAGTLQIDGYGPVDGRKSRFWGPDKTDVIMALQQTANEKGLSPDAVLEPISVSSAEKLLGKDTVKNMVAFKAGNPVVKRVKA